MTRTLFIVVAALAALTGCASTDDFDPADVEDIGGGGPAEGEPAPTTFRGNIVDVWGTSGTNMWAAPEVSGQMLFFNGSDWLTVPTGTREQMTGLWGSAADDVWASGTNGTIIHFDGTRWSRAFNANTDETIFEVSGTSADDAWAVGSGALFLRWDGSNWRRVEVDTGASFYSVSATAPDDAWAVGDDGIILHWNGREWEENQPQGSGPLLSWVHAFARDDVWVVGVDRYVAHWDGDSWQRIPVPDTALPPELLVGDDDVNFVYGADPGEVFISIDGWLLRWNGSAFVLDEELVPLESEREVDLRAMWGFPGGALFVVGNQGQALINDGQGWADLLQPAP